MHWHTEGFTSLVCTASAVNERTDLKQLLNEAAILAQDLLETK
jgi:hypothetical protein